jgi:hypothetical protein
LVCIAHFDRILHAGFNFSVEYFYAATCDHSPHPSNTAFFRSDYLANAQSLGDLAIRWPFALDPACKPFQPLAITVLTRVPPESEFVGISGQVFPRNMMPGSNDGTFEQRKE